MNRTPGSSFAFYMGGSSSGKIVNERSAMQMTAVYACVRILSEAIAGLPLHLYRYKEDGGKEKATDHPLYLLLHAFIENIDKIIQAGVDLFVALIENLPTIIVEIVKAVPKIVTGIVDAIVGLTSKMADAGASLLKGLWNGISNTANWLWNKVKGWANGLLRNIKGLLGIHSPSTVFAGIGENMGLGLGEGFVDAMEDVEKEMQNAIPTDFDLEPVRAAANFDASAVLPSANLSVAATVSAMFDLMKAYLPQMGVRQIVTDTGAVIGWLAPEMDNALGLMQKLKVRYA